MSKISRFTSKSGHGSDRLRNPAAVAYTTRSHSVRSGVATLYVARCIGWSVSTCWMRLTGNGDIFLGRLYQIFWH